MSRGRAPGAPTPERPQLLLQGWSTPNWRRLVAFWLILFVSTTALFVAAVMGGFRWSTLGDGLLLAVQGIQLGRLLAEPPRVRA